MHRLRLALLPLAAAGFLLLPLPVVLATSSGPAAVSTADVGPEEWRLPALDAVVTAPFVAPAHAYGPGHRGVDVASGSDDVLAAADGTVAFTGPVAGRGVITIDHGDGWVTSVEPVDPTVAVGDVVVAGDSIGTRTAGGHAATGTVHVGVRHYGEYVNPLSLVREIPAAVLLPCCDRP